MVRAGEGLCIARCFLTKLDALVRAAVHEHVDATLRVTRDDDGRLPHEALDEVAGVRDFRFEPDVVPRRTTKDPFLLAFVDLLVRVDGMRDTCEALAGPLR